MRESARRRSSCTEKRFYPNKLSSTVAPPSDHPLGSSQRRFLYIDIMYD